MNPPIWATHSVSWKSSGSIKKVWVANGRYQYYKSEVEDYNEYLHHWGVEDWENELYGGEEYEDVRFEVIPINLENK